MNKVKQQFNRRYDRYIAEFEGNPDDDDELEKSSKGDNIVGSGEWGSAIRRVLNKPSKLSLIVLEAYSCPFNEVYTSNKKPQITKVERENNRVRWGMI